MTHEHIHTDGGSAVGVGLIAGILISVLVVLVVVMLVFGMGPWASGANEDSSPAPVEQDSGSAPSSMHFSLEDSGFTLV